VVEDDDLKSDVNVVNAMTPIVVTVENAADLVVLEVVAVRPMGLLVVHAVVVEKFNNITIVVTAVVDGLVELDAVPWLPCAGVTVTVAPDV